MAFSIEKVTVTARSRALKAEYSMELAQDLKAVHGLDAETELANILSSEILAEINREVIRTIYATAKVGAQVGTTKAGTFDLDTDSNGRWMVEKVKGLAFQIEREANTIAKTTRRGKGNIMICSSDVASALAMAGILDYNSALASNVSLTVDDTGNTFAGTLFGRIKVYIDPYFPTSSTSEFAVIGYKGSNAYDALWSRCQPICRRYNSWFWNNQCKLQCLLPCVQDFQLDVIYKVSLIIITIRDYLKRPTLKSGSFFSHK